MGWSDISAHSFASVLVFWQFSHFVLDVLTHKGGHFRGLDIFGGAGGAGVSLGAAGAAVGGVEGG